MPRVVKEWPGSKALRLASRMSRACLQRSLGFRIVSTTIFFFVASATAAASTAHAAFTSDTAASFST
eukprot:3042106-Pleurochrysis_carterae.AAC.1